MNHTTKKINTAKLLKTILSLVMVLSLLVGCSMMFVGCSGSGNNNETQPSSNKHDPAQYEGLNDKDYFQTLTYNYLSDVTEALSKGYDAYMGGFKGGSAGAKVGMTLTLGDPVLELLEDAAGGAMDFGFLSKVSLDMDVGSKDQLTQTKMALGLNGKDIATVTMLMDMANYAMYMGVPELNSTYIKMDLMEAMGGMNGSAASMQGMMAAATQFVDELPSGAELETLINRYVKAALAELDNVKREKTTLEAGGLEQECAKMTVKIYEEDALDMAKAVLTTAKNDKDLKKINIYRHKRHIVVLRIKLENMCRFLYNAYERCRYVTYYHTDCHKTGRSSEEYLGYGLVRHTHGFQYSYSGDIFEKKNEKA